MKIPEAIADAARRLGGISGTARLDAELLMAHALGVSREALLLDPGEGEPPPGFAALLARRLAHEPIAYITGRRSFWTIDLAIGPGALVPRPDSETLIEAALDHFGAAGPVRILDLGTGPGTLLLAALEQWPRAQGLGVDREEAALAYAERNARDLGLDARARFRRADWAAGLEGAFDLILCNPPYVEAGATLAPEIVDHEPEAALFAGEDGLDAYRLLARQIPPLIAAGGIACIEIGAGQEAAVRRLFEPERVTITSRRDLSGVSRALVVAVDSG